MNKLAQGAPGALKFITNAGLVTSNGPHGQNIMTAAWVHQISYEPPLIMVNITIGDASAENIEATKEFGISLASDIQNVLSSIGGKYSGRDVNKIKLLKQMGFEFTMGKKVKVLLPKNAPLTAELKLIKQETMGDHIIFIGKVLESSVNENIKPIVYHKGKYWKLGENIPKPLEILDKINLLADLYRRPLKNPVLLDQS